MLTSQTIGETLQRYQINRREFLKFCVATASLTGLTSLTIPKIATALENSPRPSVIWLSFQGCTACVESFLRAHAVSVETLIFNYISLDYQPLLQVAAGESAEQYRQTIMDKYAGNYYVIVDGSIPTQTGYATTAGNDNLTTLKETAKGAKAIISVGTCATYGGIPYASPNPTGAVAVSDLITDKPIVNLPGCPPIPTVITAVVAYTVIMGELPMLDTLGRPIWLYEKRVHDHCPRRSFFEQGQFADTFDDEGAKQGWCLLKLGCRGPSTHNACATAQWNADTSFPITSGHGCLGCAESNFLDKGHFYTPL